MQLIAPIIVAATVSTALVGLPADEVVTPAAPAVPPQVETIDLAEVAEQAEAAAQDAPASDDARPAASPEPSVATGTAPPEFGAAGQADVVTERLDVEPFMAAGVTWDAGTAPAGLQVQVRVREAGAWTAWNTLALNDNAPDAGTDEARRSTREGTEPLLTGGADGVQVLVDSADGSLPAGLEVDLIDPGTSDHDQLVGRGGVELAAAAAGVAAPAVVTRAQWGADERLARSSSTNDQVSALVLHHTAGSNTYSQSQSVQQMRGIYAYHTGSLGWSDIGYNLLVDRYGTVYEGRRGSVTGTPQGAHSGGFNQDTYGISVMGNFQNGAVPAVVTTRLAEVVAWKMWELGIEAEATTRLTSAGGGTSRYAKGTEVTVPTFSAHRDIGFTSCPGVNLVARMDAVEADVQRRLAAAVPPPVVDRTFPKDFDGDDRADVVALDGLGRMMLYPGNGTAGFRSPRQIGQGWKSRDLVTMVGDWDGDGHPDVLARAVTDGQLWLYRSNGKGGFLSGRPIGGRWSGVDSIVGVGDWDGDGNVDVLARIRATGALNLYRGDGDDGFLSTTQVGKGWTGMNELVPAGEWAEDGVPAFLARETATGVLFLYEAGPGGTIASKTRVGHGWSSMRQMVGLGDFDGTDGNDVLAKTADNRLVLYRGSGSGPFAGSVQVGHGWGSLTILD